MENLEFSRSLTRGEFVINNSSIRFDEIGQHSMPKGRSLFNFKKIATPALDQEKRISISHIENVNTELGKIHDKIKEFKSNINEELRKIQKKIAKKNGEIKDYRKQKNLIELPDLEEKKINQLDEELEALLEEKNQLLRPLLNLRKAWTQVNQNLNTLLISIKQTEFHHFKVIKEIKGQQSKIQQQFNRLSKADLYLSQSYQLRSSLSDYDEKRSAFNYAFKNIPEMSFSPKLTKEDKKMLKQIQNSITADITNSIRDERNKQKIKKFFNFAALEKISSSVQSIDLVENLYENYKEDLKRYSKENYLEENLIIYEFVNDLLENRTEWNSDRLLEFKIQFNDNLFNLSGAHHLIIQRIIDSIPAS